MSTDDGVPTQAIMPGFEPRVSHGFPEFIQGCDAVTMGRTTFLSPRPAPAVPLRLLRSERTFPDGSAELVYAVGVA